MTDQEITEIIATKVMGWKRGEATFMRSEFRFHEVTEESWLHHNGHLAAVDEWNPITSDSDCMMAWDKLSVARDTTISNCGNVWYAECSWGRIDGDYLESGANVDRRRAMVECMVKAVTPTRSN